MILFSGRTRWVLSFLGLTVLAWGLLRYQHRGAFVDRAFGVEVANGCVAQAVRSVTHAPSLKEAVVASVTVDRGSGRFRPLFYGYMTVSFVGNALRYSVKSPAYVLRHLPEYVNGELVGHTRFQLAVLAVAIACLSLMVGRLSQSGGMALACVIGCSSAVSIGGNLLFCFADSQEILITALMGGYLLAFSHAIDAERITWPGLLGLTLLAGLTCLAKETAVVLGVAVAGITLVLVCCRLLQRTHRRHLRVPLIVALVQTGAWGILLGMVFLFQRSLASGVADAYSNRYGGLNLITVQASFTDLWRELSQDPLLRAGYGLSVGAVVLLVTAFRRHVLVFDRLQRHLATMILLVTACGLGCFLIYLPWPDHSMKYMLTAEMLMLVGVTLVFWVVTYPVRWAVGRHGRLLTSLVACLGALYAFMNAARMNQELYARYYDRREVHEAIWQDLHARFPSSPHPVRCVVLVDGLPRESDPIGWDDVQLARVLNYRYGWNILQDGKPIGAMRMSGVTIVLNQTAPTVAAELDFHRIAGRDYDVEYRVGSRDSNDAGHSVAVLPDADRHATVRRFANMTLSISSRSGGP